LGVHARSVSSNQRVAVALRRLREARRLSQEDFAARCGLHRTYVGAIERAEGNITLDTLDRVAAALGVPAAELLRTSGKRIHK
jgi:transcriptional regulator with XRE-family HTH domain